MFNLEKRYYDEMIAHARQDDPDECCGLLMGADGKVLELRRTTNSMHSPMRYNVEPKELLQAHRDMDEKSWDLVGTYHSHTHSQSYPSATDIQLAFWPDALYFIVSLENKSLPVLRAFRIKDGKVSEETINVVGSE